MVEFDVVVIGAGPVGENVADYAHRGGLSVAVVEAERAGGECSYWACIPSKALLRPAAALAAARRVRGSASAVADTVDVAETLARRDSFVAHYDDAGQASWIEDAGITLLRGRGRLAGERMVVVTADDGEIEARARRAVVVCTGSEPVLPDVEGLASAHPWTSRDATALTAVPRRVVILGGGVVACELATALTGLGAEEVTMLVRGERVLSRLEPVASEAVLDSLRERGVDVRLGASALAARRDGGPGTPVTVELASGRTVVADEVLVATGRRPRLADLGLETVGLDAVERLGVDGTLAVAGVDGGWLYAAGDAAGRSPLTHQGKYEARALGDALAAAARGEELDEARWGRHATTADEDAVPQVVFTDPEVAAVGLTEAEAMARGFDVAVVRFPLGSVAGSALHADGYDGTAAIVVDRAREVLVGATFVGPDVAELLHAATIAIVGEVPLDRLRHAVPAFPTISEVWLRLLERWWTRPDA